MTALDAQCVLLTIDPARVSGAAVLVPDQSYNSSRLMVRRGLVHHRTVRKARERAEVIAEAQGFAKDLGLKLVVCGEEWRGRSMGISTATITGMGAAWGRWLEALELAGHPARRIMRLDTGTWRSKLWRGRRVKGDTYKRWAVSWVEARYDVVLPHDEAEAVCMGCVALKSGKLAKILSPSTKARAS